jgi:hypothetical protein
MHLGLILERCKAQHIHIMKKMSQNDPLLQKAGNFQPYVLYCNRTVFYRMYRVGQNRIYTPYMTVYLMIFLPNLPYVHCIYMVLANPTYVWSHHTVPYRKRTVPTHTIPYRTPYWNFFTGCNPSLRVCFNRCTPH